MASLKKKIIVKTTRKISAQKNAPVRKKINSDKSGVNTNYTNNTYDSYSVDGVSLTGGYEVNKVTRARRGPRAGKPLTASGNFVTRDGTRSYKNNYVSEPSAEGYNLFSGRVLKSGVVGPKSVISTNASRRNIQVTRKRDEAMRRGSKNPKAGR
jgi:hypothetical protein